MKICASEVVQTVVPLHLCDNVLSCIYRSRDSWPKNGYISCKSSCSYKCLDLRRLETIISTRSRYLGSTRLSMQLQVGLIAYISRFLQPPLFLLLIDVELPLSFPVSSRFAADCRLYACMRCLRMQRKHDDYSNFLQRCAV